jgi:hypothetical protein
LALKLQQQKSHARAQCTFSGAVENLTNFAQGFSNWGDWFEIAVRSENNIYGATLLAQVELDQRITNALGLEKDQLDWSGGFLSQKKCVDVATPDGGTKQNCSIVTPGATISEALNKSLGAGQDALIEADEIDEILSALFAQLAERAFTGVDGLLGLSQGSSSGNSYLDQVNTGGGASVGFTYTNRTNLIQEAINTENKAANIQRQIIEMINDVENDIDSDCSLDLTDDLEDMRDSAQAELASSNVILGTLNSLNSQYISTTDPAIKNDIYLDYLDLESAGYVHSAFDLISFETALVEAELEVEDFEEEIDDECD